MLSEGSQSHKDTCRVMSFRSRSGKDRTSHTENRWVVSRWLECGGNREQTVRRTQASGAGLEMAWVLAVVLVK